MDPKNGVRCWPCEHAAKKIHYVMQALSGVLENRTIPDYYDIPKSDQDMYEKAVHKARYDGMTAEGAHEFWVKSMNAAGWNYGHKKCVINKTHPCLKPYSELSEYEKAKDVVFVTMARLLA